MMAEESASAQQVGMGRRAGVGLSGTDAEREGRESGQRLMGAQGGRSGRLPGQI